MRFEVSVEKKGWAWRKSLMDFLADGSQRMEHWSMMCSGHEVKVWRQREHVDELMDPRMEYWSSEMI